MRIEWSHLSKRYESHPGYPGFPDRKKNKGLFDFSAGIRQGVTAVLGQPGSGKSTLLKLTALSTVPDDGRIMYDYEEIGQCVWSKGNSDLSYRSGLHKIKEQISYIPQTMHFQYHLTVEEDLLQLAQSYRIPSPKKRVAELIARWGISAYRKTEIHQLSVGLLKRYMLAQSLLCSPRIWILDEPTEGLDELGKRLLFHELIRFSQGRITLIATRDMQLAECADHLLLLERGACRRLGSKKLLTAGVPEGTVAGWYQAMQVFQGDDQKFVY